MDPLPSLSDDDPLQVASQEPQLHHIHPQVQSYLMDNNSIGAYQEQRPLTSNSMDACFMSAYQEQHPSANSSMGAYQECYPPANNSVGAYQEHYPPMDAYQEYYTLASNSMSVSQVLPPLSDTVPTSNHQPAQFTAEPLASLLHGPLLSDRFPLFPGPSAQTVHGLKHVMAASQALGNDATMHADQEDLQYFLSGRVRPMPGVQIYRCAACGDEFANRHAFGGHMSSHSKKNNSKAKSAGRKKKVASSSAKKSK